MPRVYKIFFNADLCIKRLPLPNKGKNRTFKKNVHFAFAAKKGVIHEPLQF